MQICFFNHLPFSYISFFLHSTSETQNNPNQMNKPNNQLIYLCWDGQRRWLGQVALPRPSSLPSPTPHGRWGALSSFGLCHRGCCGCILRAPGDGNALSFLKGEFSINSSIFEWHIHSPSASVGRLPWAVLFHLEWNTLNFWGIQLRTLLPRVLGKSSISGPPAPTLFHLLSGNNPHLPLHQCVIHGFWNLSWKAMRKQGLPWRSGLCKLGWGFPSWVGSRYFHLSSHLQSIL